ncbi:MAG: hypothetical protein ABI616_08125 [Pseudomonadota bacterium]
MKRKMMRSVLALVLLGCASTAPAAICDARCLKGFMDGYLAALVKHDATLLPVASKVRFTENGVEIPLGEALWVTISGLGNYRHDFYEPATGGVSAFVTMTENGTPGYLTIRLRVVHNKLTEIETVVNRGAANASNPPTYEPVWDEVAPVNKRLTREQLTEGVIGYMRAIAFADGKQAHFAETCIRLENGNVMALGPHDKSTATAQPAAPPRDDDWAAAIRQTLGMGCSDQLDTRVYAFITEYDNPRFPIVDVERQIVFGIFNFRRRGTVKDVTINGKTYPMMPSTQWPNEVLNTQAWKFVNGEITRIEAVFLANRTYKTGTGWPGGRKGEKRAKD